MVASAREHYYKSCRISIWPRCAPDHKQECVIRYIAQQISIYKKLGSENYSGTKSLTLLKNRDMVTLQQ